MWESAALTAELIAARDPGSTSLIYTIVIVLLLAGIALAVFAWWLVRTTRPDPELLAPLEAIEGRRWRRLDPAGRRRLLDELRPDGAEPMEVAPAEPEVDLEFSGEVDMRDVRDLSDDQPQNQPSEQPAGEPAAEPVVETGTRIGDGRETTAVAASPVPGEVGLWSELPPPTGDDWAAWDERLGVPNRPRSPQPIDGGAPDDAVR